MPLTPFPADMPTCDGAFEAHITVETQSLDELDRFRQTCSELTLKFIEIVLPRGTTTHQPMTASYHRGDFAAVRTEVQQLAGALAGAGFAVLRVKIEATGAHRNVPRTDADAKTTPHNYFEYHVKALLAVGADLSPLVALVSPHGAHISRNARRIRSDGLAEHFVTLRSYGAGKPTADAKFAALRSTLVSAGYRLVEAVCEYTVYDSNTSVDAGWLP